MFFHAPFTGIRFPAVPAGQLEETIYAAVIHYCHLDREDLPVPAIFSAILSEKPAGYISSWSLLEKMEFLKQNGKRFGISTLHQLMNIVFEHNRVHVEFPPTFTSVAAFNEVLEHLDRTDSEVFESQIRGLLKEVLETYHPQQMTATVRPALDALRKYLVVANRNLFEKNIMRFFDMYGNLTTRNYQKVGEFLLRIGSGGGSGSSSGEPTTAIYDPDLFRMIQNLKNVVYMFSKVYPAVLADQTGGNDLFYNKVHAHWDLSDRHEEILLAHFKKDDARIQAFRDDSVLQMLLADISPRIAEIHLFLENMPVQTELSKRMEDDKMGSFHGVFDKRTVYALCSFCMYSLLNEFIRGVDNPELIRTETYNVKAQRRAANAEWQDEEDWTSPEMEEVQLLQGNQLEWKQRVCALLIACLEIEQENKKTIDLSYTEIMEKVNRAKENEKRGIIEGFKNMPPDARRIEDMMKKYRMGRWNVGQQRSLFEYDKQTFDREVSEMGIFAMTDTAASGADNEEILVRDVADMDAEAERMADEEGDVEAFGIDHLGENYMDGEYYSDEDNDRDDFPYDG